MLQGHGRDRHEKCDMKDLNDVNIIPADYRNTR